MLLVTYEDDATVLPYTPLLFQTIAHFNFVLSETYLTLTKFVEK
jgi:hypothetical protein